MEDGWERRAQHIAIDAATAERWVRRALPGASVAGLELLADGLCNTNYRVKLRDAARAALVLRVYQRDAAICRKEADIHKLVAGRVPVPRLLHAEVEPSDGPRFAIFEHVLGEKLERVLGRARGSEAVELGRAAGEALARIHEHRFERAGFLGAGLAVEQPFDGVAAATRQHLAQMLAGRAGMRLGSELRHRVEAWIVAHAPLLDPLDGRVRLAHADYKPTNILVSRERGAWSVAAVLDWEFALAFTPLLDVGQMLRYQEEMPDAYVRAFEDGYRASGGELGEQWRVAAALIDLLNLVGFLDVEEERLRVHATSVRLIARTVRGRG